MKLLLVEDDANVAAVLAETFREQGHQTTVIHTGEAALSHLEGERPDALILDIALPNINGIDVLRSIRAKSGRCRSSSSPDAPPRSSSRRPAASA